MRTVNELPLSVAHSILKEIETNRYWVVFANICRGRDLTEVLPQWWKEVHDSQILLQMIELFGDKLPSDWLLELVDGTNRELGWRVLLHCRGRTDIPIERLLQYINNDYNSDFRAAALEALQDRELSVEVEVVKKLWDSARNPYEKGMVSYLFKTTYGPGWEQLIDEGLASKNLTAISNAIKTYKGRPISTEKLHEILSIKEVHEFTIPCTAMLETFGDDERLVPFWHELVSHKRPDAVKALKMPSEEYLPLVNEWIDTTEYHMSKCSLIARILDNLWVDTNFIEKYLAQPAVNYFSESVYQLFRHYIRNYSLSDIDKWLYCGNSYLRALAREAYHKAGIELSLQREFEPPQRVYKKCLGGVIVEASIPLDAEVRGYPGCKCRTNKATITNIYGDFYGVPVGISSFDSNTMYRVGDKVEIENFDYSDITCSDGFHFFCTREEAEDFEEL